jgi:PadR family transcriptional regulator PadR
VSEGPARITQPLLDVLDVLLDADDDGLHGWAIIKTTRRSAPTVYKILERLDEAGWLTSRWEDNTEPGRPRRRYYRLTGHGAASARAIVAQRRSGNYANPPRHAFGGGVA